MNAYLAVAAGGAIGSVARYGLSGAVAQLVGAAFPWGTLLINVLGSVVIGAVAAVPDGRLGLSPDLRLFLMTGICGGFTTFSAFSLQALELLKLGQSGAALGYVLASVAMCIVGCWLGFLAGSAMAG